MSPMSAFPRRLLVVAAAIGAPAMCAAGSRPDIENGKATFSTLVRQMSAIPCRRREVPIEGPNLLGVVGRKAGSEPQFAGYSPALKASTSPGARRPSTNSWWTRWRKVPGTLMPITDCG